MADLRAIVRRTLSPQSMSGWRGMLWLALVAAIVIALPQARALLTLGMLGGVVLGAFLILIRHYKPGGPRRGTPIVLFPRPVTPPSYIRGGSFITSC